MTIPTFRFDDMGERRVGSAFIAQTRGTDPYAPGRRSRLLLAEILAWGLDTKAVAAAVRDEGVAYLMGLPRDITLPLTPQDGKQTPDKKTYVSEGLLNAVSFALGMHPVAFHNEKEGALIHQVVPVPGRESSVSNQGAGMFSMHTEGTHMAQPPHVLALMCVRNTEKGATNFASLDRAMKDAPPHIMDELRKQKYTQLMGVSSGGGGRYSLAIITGPEDRPVYQVDFTDAEGTDLDSCAALDYLKWAAVSCEERVVLQPGDMVVLNNRTSVHGRVGFTPDYSRHEQRWLQRQYMTANQWAGEQYDERYPHVWNGG